MKTAVITGATGFVGANLLRHLIKNDVQVHVLLRPTANRWRLTGLEDRMTTHIVNLADKPALEALFQTIQPDWIFHLAVHGAYSSQTSFEDMLQTNIMGTIALVEAASNVGFEAFVNTGSSSEYGAVARAPQESDLPKPNSHYAYCKVAATLFCRFQAQQTGLNIPTLRLYSVYGPYEEPTRLVPTLVTRALKGELPPLVNPDISHDYIHVDDVCRAYLQAVQPATRELGPIYNIGTGRQTKMREIVEVVRHEFNVSQEPRWGSMPNRNWDCTCWVSDNTKFCHAFNWSPRWNLPEGLRNMKEWLLSEPLLHQRYGLNQVMAS